MVLAIVLIIVAYGMIKKVNIFDCFIEGGSEGISIAFKLAPTLIGLVFAVTMLSSSGFFDLLTGWLAPVSKASGIPAEVIPLALIRPFSGSGAMAIFENIITKYGVASKPATVAAVLMGSTETTFYAAAVYFSAVGITKTSYTIPCALVADFAGLVMATFTVNIFGV